MPEQLEIGDERRAELGAEYLVSLGPRALCAFLFQVAHERRDVAGVLGLMDAWRAGLDVDVMKVHGGDRFPPRPLHEVP